MLQAIFQSISEGFVLGLATGVYCLSSCAPLWVPYLMAQQPGSSDTALPDSAKSGASAATENISAQPSPKSRLLPVFSSIGWFLSGRLAAYLTVGFIASLIGQLAQPAVPPLAIKIAVALSAALMLVFSVGKLAPEVKWCGRFAERLGGKLPFALGFFIGLNPCPPFIAGIARALQIGRPLDGALLFAGFFAGSSVYVLPVSAAGFLRGERSRAIGSWAGIIGALWLLFYAFR